MVNGKPINAGKMYAIIKYDSETINAASLAIPNILHNNTNVVSRVPNPPTVIGIIPAITDIGKIAIKIM